jgi:hypothetical protein
MRCPFRPRGSVLPLTALLTLALSAAGCGSGDTESGGVGTSGSAAPIGIEVSSSYVTIENRTGVPLIDGQVEIISGGVRPPFRARLARIESHARQDVLFTQFRSPDGTPFRRGISPARRVKLSAKDINGKVYEQEVPID